MKHQIARCFVGALLVSCSSPQTSSDKSSAPATAAPPASTAVQAQPSANAPTPEVGQASAPTTSERTFGAPLQSPGDPVAVANVLADPKPYLGKVVKAQGTVARVCQKAGCWLELAESAGAPGLRVPMANHAFFIPQDAIGRPAVVEGALSAQALPDSHREHLAGEGAKALGPLFLEATGVVVR